MTEDTQVPATVDEVQLPVVTEFATYAVAKLAPSELDQLVRENVGSDLTQFDFDRLKVPAGGTTTWEVPTLTGLEETKEFFGVVALWTSPRAYWNIAFDESGGGTPPDCSSMDGVIGEGSPGGPCVDCALSKFGTADKGKGQACKQMRLLFMLKPGGIMPTVIVAPPTSLKAIRSYLLRLADAQKPFQSVITRLTLEQDKNADGIKYAKIIPTMVGELTPVEADRVREYGNMIRPAVEAFAVAREDVEGPATEA